MQQFSALQLAAPHVLMTKQPSALSAHLDATQRMPKMLTAKPSSLARHAPSHSASNALQTSKLEWTRKTSAQSAILVITW